MSLSLLDRAGLPGESFRYLMDNLWDEPLRRQASSPAVNVWVGPQDAVITAELPGVDPAAVEISVEGDTLRLSGERKLPELSEGQRQHLRERLHGKFSRGLKLPFHPEVDAVEARYEHGILEIRIPKREADRPRRIAVKAS